MGKQKGVSACRDCRKCMNSSVGNLGRNSGRVTAAVMTFGMSEAAMATTKKCRVCDHQLSLHEGENVQPRTSFTERFAQTFPPQPTAGQSPPYTAYDQLPAYVPPSTYV